LIEQPSSEAAYQKEQHESDGRDRQAMVSAQPWP
jgi:hypothetical protein